eukprot:gene41643-56365_t
MVDRDEWVLHVKRALECVFANPEVSPFKPSKILQTRHALRGNQYCPKTKTVLSSTSAAFCYSCGRGFSSYEYVSEQTTLLQIGQEDCEKVCSDCKHAQMVVLWLK